MKGTLAAVVMAFVCAFWDTAATSKGCLADSFGAVLAARCLSHHIDRHALAGMAYLVGFTTLAAPANPMQYDLSLFLNASVAWFTGRVFYPAWLSTAAAA
nr:FUSC family protein [Salinicola tamaricis]